ncbi:MAG: TIGR02300 family protein [Acidobacteria bacterium]|jgi:hypothetical protein|nr:FYDLN acid domain-containing protein [Thermoanaerobaculia bacterium]NLN10319.1 TIGR02300 family protein [Acidobacteriota bacterium]MBP7813034.1 FYDLN acid domain-containing protein [Thermoanaerobaculia bacterium]MBP8845997.1 FYDLN acid domain-containing protein [Thermoanaerobaculia bacterium]HNU83366.1 FYDLN acid domain-containing protein [Thermoanaerobaculia bacterium]
MPDLGTKWKCFECETKFYDFGRPEPICPKCGADQRQARSQEPSVEVLSARRRKREESVLRDLDDDDRIGHDADEAEFDADEDEEVVDAGEVEEEDEDDLDDE